MAKTREIEGKGGSAVALPLPHVGPKFMRRQPLEEKHPFERLRAIVKKEHYSYAEIAECINGLPIGKRDEALEVLNDIAGYALGAYGFRAIGRKIELDEAGERKLNKIVEALL